MRTLSLILLIFFFIHFTFSQNNISVYTKDGSLFSLYLNDSLINKIPQASVLAEGIKKDTLKAKTILESKQSAEETVYLLDKGAHTLGKEFDYIVEVKSGKLKLIYNGTEEIPKVPKPLVPPKPVVDTSGKYRNNVLGHYCELKENNPVYFNNRPKDRICKTSMPGEYLNYMNILMTKAQTEDDKYLIAENTTRNNCVSVSQMNKILTYISYELEKLKLIKESYGNIIDKANSKRLDSTFRLESSKNELASFLKTADQNSYKTTSKCTSPSKDPDIKQLYDKMEAYRNDPEKFMVLKKMYSDYCYSVAQIKMLLGLFVHDKERLDACKLLYYYCTDTENYMKLSDVFSYNTTIADLQDFLNKQD
jgi:hypothetical protein